MYLLLIFLSTSESCDVLRNSYSLGVTPDYVPKNFPVIVYDDVTFLAHSYLIRHNSSLNDTLDILKVHMNHPEFRKDSLICVESSKIDLDLFESFWNLGIAHVVQQIRSETFMYNPFNKKIVSIKGEWRSTLRKICFTKIQIGYGTDGSFLYEISKRMNFTPEIINGIDYDYSIQQLLLGEADFGGISHFLRYYSDKIEITNALYGDEVCTVVKRAGVLRGWDIFLSAFRWQVWAFITLAALTTNLILTLICPDLTWTRWLPVTLRSMFMIPTGRLPKGIKERFIIGGCLLYGVVVVTTYQASLYKFIHDQTRYKNPEKLSEVRKTLSELTINDNLLEQYAVQARKHEVKFLVEIGKLTKEVYVVPECRSSYSLGYPFPYGSSFLKPISKFAQRVVESGLQRAWYQKTVLNQRKIKYQKLNLQVRVLNVNDFEVAFFALLLGLTISLATFILEILSSFCKTRCFGMLKTHLDPHKPYFN